MMTNCKHLHGEDTDICFILEEDKNNENWYFSDEGNEYFSELKSPPPPSQSDLSKKPTGETCTCGEGSNYSLMSGILHDNTEKVGVAKEYKAWWCSKDK